LTIDTWSLRDIWLPALRAAWAAQAVMERLTNEAYAAVSPDRRALCDTCCWVGDRVDEKVRQIAERGGLLLCV